MVAALAWRPGAGGRADPPRVSPFLETEFLVRLAGIGVLNLLLSGDNALVIALAVRALPKRQRILGQIWGALGAVVLRLLFVAIITVLLRIPLLQLVGGLLLVWIAVRLVRPDDQAGDSTKHGASLWEAIWIIVVADVTMSLDNVLAIAAAARGEMTLDILGIVLSLPIVVWGAGLLAKLMNSHVWIVWLGGGLLGYVAGEMMIEDKAVHAWLGDGASRFEKPVAVVIAVTVAVIGWWEARQKPPHVPEDV
jgi:YjbE family integral membrane protein